MFIFPLIATLIATPTVLEPPPVAQVAPILIGADSSKKFAFDWDGKHADGTAGAIVTALEFRYTSTAPATPQRLVRIRCWRDDRAGEGGARRCAGGRLRRAGPTCWSERQRQRVLAGAGRDDPSKKSEPPDEQRTEERAIAADVRHGVLPLAGRRVA